MKNCEFISNVCHDADQLEKKEDTVIILDRIDINDERSVVLCYWPWKHEYVTWDMYEMGNMDSGHYFSSEKCDVNGRVSGLRLATDDLYRRAKNAGWKPNRRASLPTR